MTENTKPEKTIAIVMPCRNEEKYILTSIRSALDQDYPKDKVTIYVVDGMSDDNTRKLLQELNDPRVKVIDNVNRTTPFALNLGIKNSKSDFVQIMGARVILSPNYLQVAAGILQSDPEIYCVGNGDCRNIYESEEGRMIARATDSMLALGFGNPRKITKGSFAQDANEPLYKRETFDIVGYFDESLTRNQDDEFSFRVKQAGLKVYATEKIHVQYWVRSSFKRLFNQYSQYGYWKVCVNKKHKNITTVRQLIPPLFVLYLLAGPWVAWALQLLPLWAAGMGVYLLALLFESVRLGKGLKEIILIQYAFFNFHFGYGSGYLKGIWDFLIRNKQADEKMHQLTR